MESINIEKAWNGYIINNRTSQTEIYKTLEDALNRAGEIFDRDGIALGADASASVAAALNKERDTRHVN